MNAPQSSTPSSLLGPGCFILVVGPSGAGKDTIIAGAKKALADNAAVVFPRRVVTREASMAEDHDSLDETEFARRRQQGDFALVWQAHGLHYGIPRSVDDDICAGRNVLCNVSRGIVAAVRARYTHVIVILITAPANVLAERLSGRGRASDGPLSGRIKRNAGYSDFKADVTIDNRAPPDAAIRQMLKTISSLPHP